MIESIMVALLLLGALFVLAGGIGIARLEDTLCQAHPLSKVVTLGLSLIFIATACALWNLEASIKLLLVILFHFTTIPLAGHIFARYATQYEEQSVTPVADQETISMAPTKKDLHRQSTARAIHPAGHHK